MSGDAEQEYFSDGISEDITTDLSKVSALAVTARNTAFTFKGQSVDVCDVAAKLGVSHVLEGSVRKAGNRVRITAQLIDGATGDHVWAERYDRDLTDIFAIQDEICEGDRRCAEDQAAAARRRRRSRTAAPNNAEAYNLFLMARQYWIDGDFGESGRERRVIRICKRVTQIDPDYAQAWALMGLAQANLRYAYTGTRKTDDGLAAAEPRACARSARSPRRICRARGIWRCSGGNERGSGGNRNGASAQSRIHGRRTRKRRESTIGKASSRRPRGISSRRRSLPKPISIAAGCSLLCTWREATRAGAGVRREDD